MYIKTILPHRELESEFRVPIFDRYSIVLQIFKERARTYEAKLQVSLAEIPYLRYNLVPSFCIKILLSILRHDFSSSPRTCLRSLQKGGSEKEGETYHESQLRLLSKRELKIKSEIESMEKKRTLLKQQRKKKEFPVVAVLGYTNSGSSFLRIVFSLIWENRRKDSRAGEPRLNEVDRSDLLELI